MGSLVPQYLSVSSSRARFSVSKFLNDIRRGDAEGFEIRGIKEWIIR